MNKLIFTKSGFTLVETMLSCVVVFIIGVAIYGVLRTSGALFAKNTAINFTHQAVRNGVGRLEQELHGSVSNPQLTDANGVILSAASNAAGISFRQYAAGPFVVYVASPVAGTVINGTSNTVSIVTGVSGISTDYKPLVGQRIHIQALTNTLDEIDITAVSAPSWTGSGTVYTLTLASTLNTTIPIYPGGYGMPAAAMHVPCFLTTPISYVVKNNQLLRTSLNNTGGTTTSVIVGNLQTSPSPLSATPFSLSSINGATNSSYVTLNAITASDPASSNRQYKTTLISLTMQTPHWGQLTTFY